MGDTLRTRETILSAAERIIVNSGLEKATIDEVAREARISKGGVLHHFPSKEAIVIALLSRLIDIFEADVNARQAEDPEPVGSFTRAFLHVVNERADNCIEVGFALKSGFRQSPALQKLAATAHARWQARVEADGLDPVRASVVRLATDGLWLARVNHVDVPSKKLRKPLMDFLIDLTRTPSVQKTAAKTPRFRKVTNKKVVSRISR
jgi:AcrR family transcriptional regulator